MWNFEILSDICWVQLLFWSEFSSHSWRIRCGSLLSDQKCQETPSSTRRISTFLPERADEHRILTRRTDVSYSNFELNSPDLLSRAAQRDVQILATHERSCVTYKGPWAAASFWWVSIGQPVSIRNKKSMLHINPRFLLFYVHTWL